MYLQKPYDMVFVNSMVPPIGSDQTGVIAAEVCMFAPVSASYVRE